MKNLDPRHPVISVVTVVFNGERCLEQAIRSVLDQDYANLEYIIIDGGSTDGTLEIIRKYEDRIDYWISEPDRGIYDAMNKGVSISTGELVTFMNSDDWYNPGALGEVAKVHASLENKDAVIGGKWSLIFEDLDLKITASPSLDFRKGMQLCHQTMFVPRSVYRDFGMYDVQYRYAADLDMAARLVRNKVPFVFLDKVMANFRVSGSSEKYFRESGREACRIIKAHFGLPAYVAFRSVRFKTEILMNASKLIEKIFGRNLSVLLKRRYYLAKAGMSDRWER